MDKNTPVKDFFEILSLLAVIVGVPVGLVQYWLAKKTERKDREYGTYNALDEKYIEFQKLCLEYPFLDIFDVPDHAPSKLSQEQKKQELIAFTMLFSIFERAHLMYCDKTTEVKDRQWTGWEKYIEDYCQRENFRKAWLISGKTFDLEFQNYMVKKILDHSVAKD